jgi:iron complex outermembrane receptor protein
MTKRKLLSVLIGRAFGTAAAVSAVVVPAYAQDGQTQAPAPESAQVQGQQAPAEASTPAPLPAAIPASSTQRVVITGSNIPRTDAETASPVQVISREEIERSGRQTVADIIHMLPADNNGTIPASFGDGFAHGAQGVSLRGLSVNSTLVLLNGRRMAPYALGDDGQRSFVDLNSIPLDAVERVEVLKDGASAIYGSDAIAGVVNIILRQNFTGGTVDVSGGTTYKNDGHEGRLAGTLGFGDLQTDNYNVFLNIETSHQAAIWAKDRPSYIGSNVLTGQGYGDSRPGGYPLDGQSLGRGSPQGSYLDLNSGDVLRGRATCPSGNIDANGLCRWSTTDYEQLQPEATRTNFYGRFTTKLPGTLEAFGELGIFESTVKSSGTPSGTRATVYSINTQKVVSQAINVAGAGSLAYNPFTDPANAANIGGYTAGDPVRYYGTTSDVGPRTEEDKNTATRVIAGLKGSHVGWDWEAAVGDMTSKLDSTLRGYLNYPAFKTAVLDGTYQPGGSNSAAVLSAVAPTLTTNSKTETSFFDFKGTRELMSLAGGPLSLAIGGEIRHESVNSPAVQGTGDGTVLGLGYASAMGSRNVDAVYAELDAPVLKTVDVSAAGRIDHYSDYGNSKTPKLGIKWTPIKELALRGTYAEGFRAPNFSENGSSATAGYVPGVNDPVRCPGGTAVSDAATNACGINVGVITVGNPNIKPEESKNYTLGFVFEPAKQVNLTLDYYHIVRKNEIVQIDPSVWAANPGAFPGVTAIRDTSIPAQYSGDPGQLLAVMAPYVNATKTMTDGVDVNLRNIFDLAAAGKITTDFDLTYLIKFYRTNADGSVSHYAGEHGPVSMSSGAGMPRVRATFSVNWDGGPTSITGRANYRGHIRNTDGGSVVNFGDLEVPKYTASFTTFDLFAGYMIDKEWKVQGSITNIFNRRAPLDLVAYANQNFNGTYDMAGAIGRTFRASLRYDWK